MCRSSPLRTLCALVVLGAGLFTVACGDDARPAMLQASLPDGKGDGVASGDQCIDGSVEPCSVTLGEHAGLISCYEGTRTCSGGRFGECSNGRAFEIAAPEAEEPMAAPGLRPLAFSSPSECLNNPCNSYCREFNETPTDGLRPELSSSIPADATWAVGDLGSYPPGTVALANREPCQTAADCQFNTACVDPSPGSCSHAVCLEGAALTPGCNRCADQVCAVDPTCCEIPVDCAHDPCEAGAVPLDATCDTCVNTVCQNHPECCSVAWDAQCVSYVASECSGQTCGCPGDGTQIDDRCYVQSDRARDFGLARDACDDYGGGWSLLEVASPEENERVLDLMNTNGVAASWIGALEVTDDTWSWLSNAEVFFINDEFGGSLQNGYTYANWGPGEPEFKTIDLAAGIDSSGFWFDSSQTDELEYFCEGPPNRLTPRQSPARWDAECLDLAEQTCGVDCSAASSAGTGSCTARIARQSAGACAAFDLAIGAPCEEAARPRVPVCNHGQLEAPAGLRLIHLPIEQVGRAYPDFTEAVDCALTTAIAPGTCVNVDDCPGLAPGRAVLVNPSDGTQNTDECVLLDNWAIFESVSCREPTCEGGVYDGNAVADDDCGIAVQQPLAVDALAAQVRLEATIAAPHCDDGEIGWGGSCYYFERAPETWDRARAICQERGEGWDLVALNSPAENGWVRGMTDTGLDVQIGLTDVAVEGDHVWSNGTCNLFSNWHLVSLQPDNDPPGSEQCARMTKESGEAWEDKACNDEQHPYVCEGPLRDNRSACAEGQLMGPDGACYAFDANPVSWSEAKAACQGMGTGWTLLTIDDSNVNAFITGLGNCAPIWLDNPPGLLGNFETPVVVGGADAPFIDELGTWQILNDGTPRATVCRGPVELQPSTRLTQVPGEASCTNNSYYFEESTLAPERLTLCPATCELARSLSSSRIRAELPCLPPAPPAIDTVIEDLYYTADCPGGSVLWDFFYYDAVTPANSHISFAIRTAPSIEVLEAGGVPFVPIADAHSTPDDTQRCEIDPPSCPVDIFSALGAPANQQRVLELRVNMIAGSGGEGPLLRDWRVRYSCPPTQ